MRLCIVTFGSEGDTRPLAALCRALIDHGHQPTLFAEQSTLDQPRRLGIPCIPLSGDVRSALPAGQVRQNLRLADVIATVKAMNAVIATNSASWLRTASEHAREADVIACSSLAVGVGKVLAEQFGKPTVGLFLQPITPSSEFCSPMVPQMNVPGWLKRLTFKATHRQMWNICGRPAETARSQVFDTHSARQRFDFAHPMLYGISRELVSQPEDWPAHHRICGHWQSAVNDSWQPPGALQEFLAKGPFYAGFGSPSAFIRNKELSALIDAVAGRPVIFSPGWSRIDASVLPSNFFVAHDVPHEWLFPRVSVAIHHGGAGTTHTAARAGVPQIVLPIGGDHAFWASRVAARGIAPTYRRGARHDSAAIRRMIEWSLRDEVRFKAQQVADAMARENGATTTVREIERTVSAPLATADAAPSLPSRHSQFQ